ncbi:hypothetical protein GE09DRAFT_1250034 [Coniochaeta sp. 2T2.1]|nr:hypothetical protein GE09DRAFT_1250034 [Coniochaeta sp. 2T2.1]
MASPTPAIKIGGQPYGIVAETEEVFSDEEVLDDAPISEDEKEAAEPMTLEEELEADLHRGFEESWEQLESQDAHKPQQAEAEAAQKQKEIEDAQRSELQARMIADFELRMAQENDRTPDEDEMLKLRHRYEVREAIEKLESTKRADKLDALFLRMKDREEAINYVYTYGMPAMIQHPPSSRPRPRQRYQDDEYVGVYLELGDWEGVETLTYSETLHLLNKLHKTREKTRRRVEYEVIRQAREYVEAVANYPTPESTAAVENPLKQCTVLHPFERGMLGSLGFQDAEEAKTLVKSLDGRFDKADVGAMDWDERKKLLLRVDPEIKDKQITALGVAGTLSTE